MALRDFLRSLRPRSTEPQRTGSNLYAARDRLREDLSSDQKEYMLELSACSMRYYVFGSILNGRTRDAEMIRAALEDVDIQIPNSRLRLATLQIEAPDLDQIPSIFDMLHQTVVQLSECINRQRYAQGEPRILAHLTDAQEDKVCLKPLLEEEVDAAYFLDYLNRVNHQLQERFSWHFTACISEEFSDLTQLAQVYFDTRRIHELLVDTHAEGAIWLAEQQRAQWEPKPDTPETVWWVEPMRQYVMEQYSNPDLNIAFLARQFGISPAYVGRKFRQATGIGLLELIHRCRLTELDRRLSNGETIKDATAAVGYSSLLTMQRARERYSHE